MGRGDQRTRFEVDFKSKKPTLWIGDTGWEFEGARRRAGPAAGCTPDALRLINLLVYLQTKRGCGLAEEWVQQVLVALQEVAHGTVTCNQFLLRCTIAGHEFTVFADGRAIIKGTSEPDAARSLYAKYIGS